MLAWRRWSRILGLILRLRGGVWGGRSGGLLRGMGRGMGICGGRGRREIERDGRGGLWEERGEGRDAGGCAMISYGIDLANTWTDIERKILDRRRISILIFSHYRVPSSLVHFVFFHQASLICQIHINIIFSSLLETNFSTRSPSVPNSSSINKPPTSHLPKQISKPYPLTAIYIPFLHLTTGIIRFPAAEFGSLG